MKNPTEDSGAHGRARVEDLDDLLDDRVVEALLRRSPPRPTAPDSVKQQVRGVAREAWRGKVAARRGERSVERFRSSRPPARSAARRPPWRSPLALAALLVLGLGAGLILWTQLGPPATGPGGGVTPVEVAVVAARFPAAGEALPAVGDRLVTGDRLDSGGGRLALRLVSGASLRLDRGTRAELLSPTAFALESGAVYVDSGASDSAIEVRTPRGVVRDIGTQFETRLVETGDGEVLSVAVREGEVRVEVGAESHRAVAGTALAVDASGAVERADVTSTDPRWAWAEAAAPPFGLEGRTLSEVLAWVAREKGWSVRYQDPELRRAAEEIVTHGSMEGLSAGQVPDVVVPVAGLVHRLEGDVLVLERP